MRFPRSRGSQFYLLMVLAVVVGLLLLATGYWRRGLAVIGLTFIAGGVARSLISPEQAGMLRVRGRSFDVLWTSFLGGSLTVLAVVVPSGAD